MLLQFFIVACVATWALVQIALCFSFLVLRILREDKEKQRELARHWQPSIHDMDTMRTRRIRL